MQNEIWLKAHIVQKGHLLQATVGTVDGMNARLIDVTVDLRPIAAAVVAYHKKLHAETGRVGSCIGCDKVGFLGLSKVVKKVGRNKLVRKIGKITRPARRVLKKGGNIATSVIKSKELGIGLGALAIAFPPVGAPSLAAYASANATLAVAAKGKAVSKAVRSIATKAKIVGAIKKKAKGKTRAQLAQAIKKTPGARQGIKRAIAAKRAARKLGRNKKLLGKIRATQAGRKKALKVMKNISSTARYSDDPKKRLQATQAAQVLGLVANARTKLSRLEKKKAPQAETGILITSKGPIKGKFRALQKGLGTHPDILMLAHDTESGAFEKIGGCVGCGLFNL